MFVDRPGGIGCYFFRQGSPGLDASKEPCLGRPRWPRFLPEYLTRRSKSLWAMKLLARKVAAGQRQQETYASERPTPTIVCSSSAWAARRCLLGERMKTGVDPRKQGMDLWPTRRSSSLPPR